ASALERIEAGAHEIENEPAERNPAVAHMFIINPLSGRGMDNLFSTHPSTENRIAALDQLAQEMGVTRHEAWDDPARSTAGPWAPQMRTGQNEAEHPGHTRRQATD